MNNFTDILKSMPDYIGSNGRSEVEIVNAEADLGVSFAKDYRKYLKEIGLACFDGHELTGLTNIERVDVVSVTKEQKCINEVVSSDWYVVEKANIDGIVIWQDADGPIYQTSYNSPSIKIADSLSQYIVDFK